MTKRTANKLTLREKIGQLIVTGFPGPAITEEFTELVADCKIGNVILFSHNAVSVPQLGGLCTEIHSLIESRTGLPAFISIDQEGGRVTRLPEGAANVPGAMAVASTGRPEHAYAAGRMTARELRALGINFNLAPVLDINNNKDNPVINVRSYGDTAETVEEYGLPMMKGLQDGGVLSALKHFPGHGDTAVDSHLGLPSITKTLEELERLELRPFVRAIREGAESIMSAHILFPKIEAERVPATMSRTIITGLLKEKLGYTGLVVSDCLEMEAIKTYYGTAEGALGALKAGVHLIFISHTATLVREAVARIERAVLEGELPEAVLDEAVEKVLHYKMKYRAEQTGERDQTTGSSNPPAGSGNRIIGEGDQTAEAVNRITGEGDQTTEAVNQLTRGRCSDGEARWSVVGCASHMRTAEAVSLDSICLVSGELETLRQEEQDVLFLGCLPFRTDLASNAAGKALSFAQYMGEAFAVPYRVTGFDPDAAEIADVLEAAAGFPRVVIGLYNGQNYAGQLELANRLSAAGHRVTAAALGKPYDLELLQGAACTLAAFDYTRLSLGSLAKILGGEALPVGRLSLGSSGNGKGA